MVHSYCYCYCQASSRNNSIYGISFNREATEKLGNAPYVKFGFIKDNNVIVIKPYLTDEDNAIKLVDNTNSDQKRLNKKDLINTIKHKFNIDLKRALRVLSESVT